MDGIFCNRKFNENMAESMRFPLKILKNKYPFCFQQALSHLFSSAKPQFEIKKKKPSFFVRMFRRTRGPLSYIARVYMVSVYTHHRKR